MPDAHKISRYPGIRSFERQEQHLFFGRDGEALDLFSTVKVKPLTVLFAKSGIGKTSLINAGLLPHLEDDYFEPIKIRLQDTSLSPVETVKEVLKPYLDQKLLNRFTKGEPLLWEYIRACRFEKNGEDFVPVLIFDQFEEFFNHKGKDQRSLNIAVANLVNERLPDPVQKQFRSISRKDRTEADLDWFSPIDIRIVLAIRSDRMSTLDDLKYYIPTILHDRFQLRALQADAAQTAIVAPAAIANQDFSTLPFEYEEAAIQTMLATLSNEQGEIESFQLQLLCQYIEQQLVQAGSKGKQVVSQTIFGGKEGINSILNDYYEREIEKLPIEDQTIARRFIEEGLIVDEQRVGLGAGLEQTRFGVSESLLARLLESRLIRAEQIHLGKIYELSHDTLVDPILKSFEKRRLTEERLEAQAKLEAEHKRLEDANRKKRQARILALLGFFLFFLALLGGIFAYRNYVKSELAKKAAERSEVQARSAGMASKAWNVYRTDHTLALRLAEAALKIDSTNEEVNQTLDQMINLPSTTLYKTVLTGHIFEVTDIAFSNDGKTIVTSSFDTDIIIWDQNGKLVKRIVGAKFNEESEGHRSSTTAVAISPDGQFIFSGGQDDLGKLWTISGEFIQNFEGHDSYVNDVAYAPDGQLLLTGSRDGTAKLWTPDGEIIRTFKGHSAEVSSVAFGPKGNAVLTGSLDGTVRLWSLAGNTVQQINLGALRVLSVAFSPSGKYILIGTSNNEALLYTLDGKLQTVFVGHTAEVTDVAFSPDEQIIATASWDNTSKLWTIEGELIQTFKGHTEKITTAGFSSDGRYLYTGGFDYTAKIWDLDLNLHAYHNPWHTNSITAVDVSPDSKQILTGSRDNLIKLWDLDGRLIQTFVGHQNWITAASFSPDGRKILSSSRDKTAIIWDVEGKPLHEMEGYSSAVNHAAYSPDGQLIATADGRDLTVTIWNGSGEKIKAWEAHKGSVQGVQFSPDGKSLLSCGYDGFIRIWNLDGVLVDSINNNGVPVHFAAFDPGNEGIWSAGEEVLLKHWNKDGTLKQSLSGHFDENYAINFHPDQKHFVTSSWDRTAGIWDLNGTLLHKLEHPHGVYAARFFPNGEFLVTGCRDNYVRIWNMSGQMVNALGIIIDPRVILNKGSVAALSQIPFSLSDFGLSEKWAETIFNDKPEDLIKQGNNLYEIAVNEPGRFAASLENYDKAIYLFQLADKHELSDSSDLNIPMLIANIYADRTYHLMIHQQYTDALASAKTGLTYGEVDFLKVFEIIGLLLNDHYEGALKKALKLKDLPTPENEYYQSYKEAIQGEIDLYRSDYGMKHPDLERFLEALE